MTSLWKVTEIDTSLDKFNIFNYKRAWQSFSIDDLKAKPPEFSSRDALFKYIPTGHVITGDFSIIFNEKYLL
jgi:hypothetical protein